MHSGSFTDERVDDPAVAAARDKIKVDLSEIHPITRTKVRLLLKDGRSFEAWHDSGEPETDLARQKNRLQGKFTALAGEVLGPARATELLGVIDGVEREPDMSRLMRLTA